MKPGVSCVGSNYFLWSLKMSIDPEDVEEEGRLMFGVTMGICFLFTIFSYLGDTSAIIYIYLGWCVYVAIFSIIFRKRLKHKYGLVARNKTP